MSRLVRMLTLLAAVSVICINSKAHGQIPASHERKYGAHYVPWFMKTRIDSLTRQVNARYADVGLPSIPDDWFSPPGVEDKTFPPKTSFNLISALHHVSWTMAITFECSHGTLMGEDTEPMVSYEDILDIQLNLYDVMFNYVLANRLYWE